MSDPELAELMESYLFYASELTTLKALSSRESVFLEMPVEVLKAIVVSFMKAATI